MLVTTVVDGCVLFSLLNNFFIIEKVIQYHKYSVYQVFLFLLLRIHYICNYNFNIVTS